jgi:hypothetical protein
MLLTGEPKLKRTQLVIFLVGISEDRLDYINFEMGKVIDFLKKEAENNPDTDIEINLFNFSDGGKWLYKEPIAVQECIWRGIANARHISFVSAFANLNDKLSIRNGFIPTKNCFAPIIILIADDVPTDNYQPQLKLLRQNQWFRCAMKFAIGDKYNQELMADYTGNKEAVNSFRILKKFLPKMMFHPHWSDEIMEAPVSENPISLDDCDECVATGNEDTIEDKYKYNDVDTQTFDDDW